LRERSSNLAHVFVRAASVAAAAALVTAGAGCSGGDGDDDAATIALAGLYAIDHDGTEPTGNALAPYERAFEQLTDHCAGTAEELASSVQGVSFDASNGSGTRITNLEALRAVNRFLDGRPAPSRDCSGVFVGVQAFLQGSALDG
jgi:hypothetical protein